MVDGRCGLGGASVTQDVAKGLGLGNENVTTQCPCAMEKIVLEMLKKQGNVPLENVNLVCRLQTIDIVSV